MGKFLFASILIAVLPYSISATTTDYCKMDYSGDYRICRYADMITSIDQISNDGWSLILDVDKFSTIASYAFRNIKAHILTFHSSNLPNCNPKFIHITPKSFKGFSVSVLELQCMKLIVKPNPFKSFKSITTLNLKRIEWMGHMWEFFADFPFLDSLLLSHLTITKISPDIFSGITGNLKRLTINVNLNVVEPRSFERFHNLESLTLNFGLLNELRSGMFYGLSQLRHLNLDRNNITVLRKHILNKLPPIQKLSLWNNKIKTIELEAFSGLNLTFLTLSNNNLEVLPFGVFQNLNNLVSLDLSYNSITSVPGNVFEGCFNLRYLFLHDNRIHYIQPTSFWGLNLDILDLSHNSLTVLQHDMFTGLQLNYLLSLDSNNICKIEAQVFRNFRTQKVSLCSHNITQIDRDRWGVDKSVKDITIHRC